jgi:hypothetical protein
MPLSSSDRRFLKTADRMKIFLVALALVVLIFLACAPSSELTLVTAVLGMSLCGIFWLTQRLLTVITVLDTELSRLIEIIRRTLPEESRKQVFRELQPPPGSSGKR